MAYELGRVLLGVIPNVQPRESRVPSRSRARRGDSRAARSRHRPASGDRARAPPWELGQHNTRPPPLPPMSDVHGDVRCAW